MKVLISPVSLEEAELVAASGTDILDIKNTNEGSLGAQFPWIIKDIVNRFSNCSIICSATLGDLPYKPGTAALAAYGLAHCGVSYIKAGLHGVTSKEQGLDMMKKIVDAAHMVNPTITMVASGYADFRKFNGLHFMTIVDIAKESGSSIAMLDTYNKDGDSLFDVMSIAELKEFTSYAHELKLQVALAGSITPKNLESALEVNPDIIGVRGAVCGRNNRKNMIDQTLLKEFLKICKPVNSLN